MPIPVLKLREPCAGPHDFHPHDHSVRDGLPPKFRAARTCSGRYWCRSCRRWFGGPSCNQDAD